MFMGTSKIMLNSGSHTSRPREQPAELAFLSMYHSVEQVLTVQHRA